ncbi:response regulator [Phormidium tenue FACHB-886]|nr:response regulator [Phormidium tenue FACHB-886]
MHTVLVIDDIGRAPNTIALEQAKFNVVHAQGVDEARAKIVSQKPDCIVLDPEVSRGDGAELGRDLKADPNTGSIPIIFCISKGVELQGDEQGAAAYIAKPVDQEKLIHTVQQILNR